MELDHRFLILMEKVKAGDKIILLHSQVVFLILLPQVNEHHNLFLMVLEHLPHMAREIHIQLDILNLPEEVQEIRLVKV